MVNIDIQDNHEEATIGAFLICELVETLSRSNDVDDEISEILLDMEAKCNRPILHCVLFYWFFNVENKQDLTNFCSTINDQTKNRILNRYLST